MKKHLYQKRFGTSQKLLFDEIRLKVYLHGYTPDYLTSHRFDVDSRHNLIHHEDMCKVFSVHEYQYKKNVVERSFLDEQEEQ